MLHKLNLTQASTKTTVFAHCNIQDQPQLSVNTQIRIKDDLGNPLYYQEESLRHHITRQCYFAGCRRDSYCAPVYSLVPIRWSLNA